MAYVVLAGLFEPGTVVQVFPVSDEETRVGAVVPAGERIADSSGTVGFDGLDAGARYFARGTDGVLPVEVACRALADGDVGDISQPPIVASPQPLGTQEVVPPVEAPAVPSVILQTGVPAGLPAGVTT